MRVTERARAVGGRVVIAVQNHIWRARHEKRGDSNIVSIIGMAIVAAGVVALLGVAAQKAFPEIFESAIVKIKGLIGL